ncbi:dienelactone hydrolase family protein [Halobacillus andaensis]|uniref:dienelactone hydrolase family protein n=1 Tax=Halobacillus andaensis TaxID=1176239 RepID=UPI003D739371
MTGRTVESVFSFWNWLFMVNGGKIPWNGRGKHMQEVDYYLRKLYEDATNKKLINKRRMVLELQQMLGSFPQSRRSGLVQMEEPVYFDDYRRERIKFNTTKGLFCSMYVLTPNSSFADSKFSPVLALHGHGKGSKEAVGMINEATAHRDFGLDLVKKGFKVFVPEIVGFGERMLEEDLTSGKRNSCYSLAVHLLMSGKTLAGLRVYEARCAIDIIEKYEDVNRDQLGVVGFSGGGLIAALLSILDRRVEATVLSGFANTYKGSILNSPHCIDNYIPQLLKLGELPSLIGLICPRPLFIESGDKDTVFPGTRLEKPSNILSPSIGNLSACFPLGRISLKESMRYTVRQHLNG